MKVVVRPSSMPPQHGDFKRHRMVQMCLDGRWSDGSGGYSVELRPCGTSNRDENMTFRPTWRVESS